MKAMCTDISIPTCRAEGYIVVFGSVGKRPIDKTKQYRITQSNPEVWPSGYLIPSRQREHCDKPIYFVDDCKSFEDLVEILNEDYEAVASCCGYDSNPTDIEEPTMMDFLSLASDLVMYYGNHYFTN